MDTKKRKRISIITPVYNEEDNVRDAYREIKRVCDGLSDYDYEHIFIDNASKDKTVNILKDIAEIDKNVKIIVNSRNFGYIRSPSHALFQCQGDAAINIPCDLQEPPSLIKDFVRKWEEGYKVVIGIKNKSEENPLMFALRKIYYILIEKLADEGHIRNFNAFGLYDRSFIEAMRKFDDPYPYLRGLISEIGFDRAEVNYTQAARKKGKSKSDFYSLYDAAMLGFVNHSKIPLRLASFIGFAMSIVSFLIALIYLIYKLLHWQEFELGLAPIVVGLFFLGSIQLSFIGILGEYILAIYTQVKKRPLVIEKERVNFD